MNWTDLSQAVWSFTELKWIGNFAKSRFGRFGLGIGYTSQGSAGRPSSKARQRSKAVHQGESREPSKAGENRVCRWRRIEKQGRRECKAVQKGKAEQWPSRQYEDLAQSDGWAKLSRENEDSSCQDINFLTRKLTLAIWGHQLSHEGVRIRDVNISTLSRESWHWWFEDINFLTIKWRL